MSDDQHLRKNENDYWLCPLCGHALIYEQDPRKLHCPKMVQVYGTTASGIRWDHYDHQVNAFDEITYCAVIPPFLIYYNTSSKNLRVRQMGISRDDWRLTKDIYEHKPVEHEDVLKMYQRLANLKVFA